MESKSETRFSPDPSSTFSFSFALKLEVGTDPSSVDVVPPSYVSTSLLWSVHPVPPY